MTRANTDDRPARSNCSPSHRTVTSVADSGRRQASDSPVEMERSTPGANESTRSPVNDHPAPSGVERDRIGAVGERTVGTMQGHGGVPGRTIRAARSMAPATSPSGGYSSARPTTRPRTFGTSIAAAHDS